MKKIVKIFTLIMMVLSLSVTLGCEREEGKVKEHGVSDEIVDVTSNSNGNNSEKIVEDTITYSGADSILVVYKKYNVNQGETFSTIKAYNKDDELIWNYTTETVADPQYPIYKFLGGHFDYVFLKDNKDIIVIDIRTGKEYKKIENVGYNISLIGIDTNYIYIGNEDGNGLFLNSISLYNQETLEHIDDINIPEKYKNMEYSIREGDGIFMIFSEYHANSSDIEYSILLDLNTLKKFDSNIKKIK